MTKLLELRCVSGESSLKKQEERIFKLQSPHHNQELKVLLFPAGPVAEPFKDIPCSTGATRILGEDWSIRFSHFEPLAEAWFGASLNQYQGVLRQWIFDLIPVCLEKDFGVKGLSACWSDRGNDIARGGDRYLLQCMVGESLIAQSHVEVSISSPIAESILLSALNAISCAYENTGEINTTNLVPERIPPLIFHMDIGLFRPFPSDNVFGASHLGRGAVWVLDAVNLSEQGFCEQRLGLNRLLLDLNLESTSFGVLSMSRDEESPLSLPVIKSCLALDQHIVVRAGSFSLTLEQIACLQRGELIKLSECEFPQVRLMSGCIEIGRAEMVECDGKPAIQIIDLYQRKPNV